MTTQPYMSNAIRNDKWITDAKQSDPLPLPIIRGYFLLARPVPIRTETKGGIQLPDQFLEDARYLTTVGRVLVVGDLCYQDLQQFGAPDFNGEPHLGKAWCRVGDFIVYGRYSGEKFIYKGVRVLLLKDNEVRMVIPDPKNIDPAFELML